MKMNVPDIIKEVFLEHRTASNLFGLGTIILLFVYALDKLYVPGRAVILGYSYSDGLFYIGLVLTLISLVIIVCKSAWNCIKILYYRHEYPIDCLDTKFYLVQFKEGAVFLFDNCTKKSHWVASWQTAADLNFHLFWTTINKSYVYEDISKDSITTRGGVKVNLGEFTQEEKIHTRGVPGT